MSSHWVNDKEGNKAELFTNQKSKIGWYLVSLKWLAYSEQFFVSQRSAISLFVSARKIGRQGN